MFSFSCRGTESSFMLNLRIFLDIKMLSTGLVTAAACPVYEILKKPFLWQGVPHPFSSATLLVLLGGQQWHTRVPLLPVGSLTPDPKCISFLISGASGGCRPPQKHCQMAQECRAGVVPCAGGGSKLLCPCLLHGFVAL